MSMKGNQDKVRLYHYTDTQGMRGIATSGKINQSTGDKGDAAFGPGTYLTSKDPASHSKSDIAWNNYDDGKRFAMTQKNAGRTDYAVAVDVPKDAVTKVPGTKRDVWVHHGDLDVEKHGVSIEKTSTKKK